MHRSADIALRRRLRGARLCRVAAMGAELGGVLGSGSVDYRPFYDDDGAQILSVYEADLPIMPAPLTLHALESSYLDGTSMTLRYDHQSVERSAIITVTRDWTPVDVVAEDVPFGPHTAVMVVAGNNYGVRWRTDGLVYELQYIPDPGEDSTPDGLRNFLASCAWP